MYKETLRSIAGIGLFPVVSLVLFITVFVLAVIRAIRVERTDAEHLASLPLHGGEAATAAGQDVCR